MRIYDAPTLAAIALNEVAPRQFITFFARDRGTNAIVQDSYWSDVGVLTANVIDPATGSTVSRTYASGGNLIGLTPISSVVGLTVQTINVQLSQVSANIDNLIRTYDIRQSRIEIHTGLMNINTYRLISPATPIFVGYVDSIELTTPKEGEYGGAMLSCVSQTQEMTRKNSATASDADQKLRNPTDTFFKHAATVGSWQVKWGLGVF